MLRKYCEALSLLAPRSQVFAYLLSLQGGVNEL
jgi:hypothetical protein